MKKIILILLPIIFSIVSCAPKPGQYMSAKVENIDSTEQPVENLLGEINADIAEHPWYAYRHMDCMGANFWGILEGHPPEEIIPFLGHTSPALRDAVFGTLNQMGDDATESIQSAIENGDSRIKYMLLWYFDRTGSAQIKYCLLDEIIADESLPVFYEDYYYLWEIMESENTNVQWMSEPINSYPVDIYAYLMRLMSESEFAADKAWAARMLGSFGDEAVDAIPAIISLFDLDDEDVSRMEGGMQGGLANCSLHGAAAIALGDFGPAGSEAIPVLLEALNSTDTGNNVESVRTFAASSLYFIGYEPDKMVQLLVDKLQTIDTTDDMNNDQVGEIAAHLGRIGPDASAAIPRLIELAEHGRYWVDGSARYAISSIEGSNDTAIRLLINQLDTDDQEHRTSVIDSLSRYWDNEDRAQAIPAILGVMSDCHGESLNLICGMLLAYGGYEDVVASRIIDEINNHNEGYSRFVPHMSEMGISESVAIPMLKELIMDDEETSSLNYAVTEYIQIGGDVGWLIPRLIDLLGWDKTENNACDVAIWALKDIGPEASEALPYLREIAERVEGEGNYEPYYAREAIAAIEGTSEN
ncbi:MAG: HEAT repeat domain-containing protein [bacterium]|nr:HEAT repeat domain-containing protein [bacterium]